jgi:hypothetical protein
MVFLFCHQSSHTYTHKQVHREEEEEKKNDIGTEKMSTIAIV